MSLIGYRLQLLRGIVQAIKPRCVAVLGVLRGVAGGVALIPGRESSVIESWPPTIYYRPIFNQKGVWIG